MILTSDNERLNNIYVIDTNMCGLRRYNAAYLVEGKELALIDTGYPVNLEVVRAGIKAHGFNISDLSYIFVTHCEHPDHSGNVAPLLRDSPKASVYINPAGLESLTNPEIEFAKKSQRLSPERMAQIGKMEPVPVSRIKFLIDGDEFDLGNGENLRIIFASGHQPSGLVIFEEKNRGLFIHDLVGCCLPDFDTHYTLNPPGSDHREAIESIKKLMELPVQYLFMGHYGISDKPKKVMAQAIKNMQMLLDMGKKSIREGKPEEIASKFIEFVQPELNKFKNAAGGEAIYHYASQIHLPGQAKIFTRFCQDNFKR